MKKIKAIFFSIFIIVLIILTFVLLGKYFVAKTPAPRPVHTGPGNYEATVNISYDNLNATAQITQSTPKSCVVVFSEPKSLEGMSVVFEQDIVSVSFKDLNFALAPSGVPSPAMAKLTVSTINDVLRSDGFEDKGENGEIVFKGTALSGDFFISLNSETKHLEKLSLPDKKLEIEFINFRFLN